MFLWIFIIFNLPMRCLLKFFGKISLTKVWRSQSEQNMNIIHENEKKFSSCPLSISITIKISTYRKRFLNICFVLIIKYIICKNNILIVNKIFFENWIYISNITLFVLYMCSYAKHTYNLTYSNNQLWIAISMHDSSYRWYKCKYMFITVIYMS